MLKKFALLSAVIAAVTIAAIARVAHGRPDHRSAWSIKSVKDSRDGGMLDFRYVRIIRSQSCAEFAFGIWK
jgi:hypothetical protein